MVMAPLHYVENKKGNFFLQSIYKSGHMLRLSYGFYLRTVSPIMLYYNIMLYWV